MLAGLTEDLHEKIGGAVHDLRVVDEIRRAVDEAVHLAYPLDPVEIAEMGLGLRDDVERTEPGCRLAVLDGYLLADLAHIFELAVPEGHLAGDEQDIAGLDAGDVIGDWGGRLGQLDLEVLEARIDLSGHGPAPSL